MTTERVVLERHVPSMGGNAHVIAVAPNDPAAQLALTVAADRLAELERLWSRFRTDSEISRLGDAHGRPVKVSADTRLLIRWCVDAWRRSGGRFDPSVRPALERLGYDRTFSRLEGQPIGVGDPGERDPSDACPAPGCAGIVVDDAAGTVTVPVGTKLDPGGIGKGLAADLVTAAMMASGALGACVNLAGDIRVRGTAPDDQTGWTVAVEHPFRAGDALAVLQMPAGGAAVASSSVLLRRWGAGHHHLIDPTQGRPTESSVAAVTVVAEEGAWADAATKLAFVASDPETAVSELNRLEIAAILVLHDGTVLTSASLSLASSSNH